MRIEQLFEQTVKLSDIYDIDDLNDETELIYHYVDPDQLDDKFKIINIKLDDAKQLKTPHGDMTVIDSYDEFAIPEQQGIVKQKMKNYDDGRILVLYGDTVIDGNHHLIASIKLGKGVRAIDIKT